MINESNNQKQTFLFILKDIQETYVEEFCKQVINYASLIANKEFVITNIDSRSFTCEISDLIDENLLYVLLKTTKYFSKK